VLESGRRGRDCDILKLRRRRLLQLHPTRRHLLHMHILVSRGDLLKLFSPPQMWLSRSSVLAGVGLTGLHRAQRLVTLRARTTGSFIFDLIGKQQKWTNGVYGRKQGRESIQNVLFK